MREIIVIIKTAELQVRERRWRKLTILDLDGVGVAHWG